jgi:hypothetical protein
LNFVEKINFELLVFAYQVFLFFDGDQRFAAPTFARLGQMDGAAFVGRCIYHFFHIKSLLEVNLTGFCN